MRVTLPLVAAAAVTTIGLAGLFRGAVPQGGAAVAAPAGHPPIVVTDAYVRQPASPDVAAAYFTVTNTTGSPDRLVSVVTGAGQQSVLHTETANGNMVVAADGLLVPAHSSVTLSPGKGHVMIQKLYGALLPGQTVRVELDFTSAGTVVVTVPVIAINAPAPTGGAPAPTDGASH